MPETICPQCSSTIQENSYRCKQCGTSTVGRTSAGESNKDINGSTNVAGFIGWTALCISIIAGSALGILRGSMVKHSDIGGFSPFLQGLGLIGGGVFMVVMYFYCLRISKFGILRWEVTFEEMPLGYKVAQVVHAIVAGGSFGFGLSKLIS